MSELMAWAAELDVQALLWINRGWSGPRLDVFFTLVSAKPTYIVPAAAFAAVCWFRKGIPGRICLLSLVLAVALTDTLADRVIKPRVKRPRPFAASSEVLIPHGESRSFSFPSSHAASMAAANAVVALTFPAWALPTAVLTALIGLSRIYLGVHYPSDVLAGWLLGSFIGWACWTLVGLAAEGRRRAAGGLEQPRPRSSR